MSDIHYLYTHEGWDPGAPEGDTTAAQIAAFLEDEEHVEALTNAVQELHRIFRDGTADRPPRGILPIETIQTMSQEDHRQLHRLYNPPPFRRTIPTEP